ncbi:hypothetical protein Hdeb2414_s0109g00797361 [Helianthus debilis subsp. tardiflorus]
MGVRPLREDEELWYEKIHCKFMYPAVDVFAAPPTTTEGAHILNPRPCRAITPAGEEVVLLSSDESIASSKRELNSPSNAFAGSLRELGVDHEDKKPRRPSNKKVVTVVERVRPKKQKAAGVASDDASHKGTARSLDDFVYVADSMEELYSIGGKSKAGGAAGARSSGSVISKD